MVRSSQLKGAALLVLFLLPYLAVLFKDVQSTMLFQIELQDLTSNKSFQEESDSNWFNVSWTSTWDATPTELRNHSIAVGDHVVLNITCNPPPSVNVTGLTLEVSGLLHPLTLTRFTPDSKYLFDTYMFGINVTANLVITATTNTSQILSSRYENVTFNNFFTPKVTLIAPNGGEDWTEYPHMYNITWTASDANDDMLLFEVSYSHFGYTWGELESGTQDDFCFSNGLYYFEFANRMDEISQTLIRVTVFDNDTDYAAGPNPMNPEEMLPTLWPALNASDRSDDYFYYGTDLYNPPDEVPEINEPPDVTFYEGELGHVIEWTLYASYYRIEYTISRNGIELSNGTLGLYGSTVTVSLDGLPAGVYEYKISAVALWQTVDTVVVTVLSVVTFAVLGLSVMALTVTLLVMRRKSLSSI